MTSKKEFYESRGYNYDSVHPILMLEDLRRKTNQSVEDIHHLLPRDEGGQDVRDNRVKIVRRVHEAHHTLYRNALPHEQPIINMSFNDKVLTKDVKSVNRQYRDAINTLVNREMVYKNGVLRPFNYS